MNLITATLIAICDLRPLDFDSGKRLAIPVDECAECQRCGRLHAVVWTVEVTDEQGTRRFDVGSTCGKRMVAEGLLPEFDKLEVKAARKAKREREQGEVDAKLAELAGLVADKAAEAVEPPIERRPDKPAVDSTDDPIPVWGMGDATVWCPHGPFDAERERTLRGSWRRNTIHEAAELVDLPGMFSVWEVTKAAETVLRKRSA